MLPELSVAGSCLQQSLRTLNTTFEILCAASGIQEHGRGRLARPLGEPAGHGAQQLPRQSAYPNAHPGERLSLIAANSITAHWCCAMSFFAESMHCHVQNVMEQSDMIQACCLTTPETHLVAHNNIKSSFNFEAVLSTNLIISASPFISQHYCTVIKPLLLSFVVVVSSQQMFVQAGQYTQPPTRSQGTGPNPQHRVGVSPQHQMQGSPQRQPQGRHQSRDRTGAIMRPQLTGQHSNYGHKKCSAA